MSRRDWIVIGACLAAGGAAIVGLNAAPLFAYVYGLAFGVIAAAIIAARVHDARLDR